MLFVVCCFCLFVGDRCCSLLVVERSRFLLFVVRCLLFIVGWLFLVYVVRCCRWVLYVVCFIEVHRLLFVVVAVCRCLLFFFVVDC